MVDTIMCRMASDWYYTSIGKQCGPVPLAKLAQLAKSGRLVPTDYVWTEGMSDWALGSTINGLFPNRPDAVSIPAAGALVFSTEETPRS